MRSARGWMLPALAVAALLGAGMAFVTGGSSPSGATKTVKTVVVSTTTTVVSPTAPVVPLYAVKLWKAVWVNGFWVANHECIETENLGDALYCWETPRPKGDGS